MRRSVLLLSLLLCLLLVACQSGPPATPEGPTVGDIPVLAGAEPLEPGALPAGLVAVTQAHRVTIDNPLAAHFRVELPLIDTIDFYHTELRRFDWTLIDVLEFGDGGFLRRYHRDAQRAIVAFHPRGETTTDFLLMQGEIR